MKILFVCLRTKCVGRWYICAAFKQKSRASKVNGLTFGLGDKFPRNRTGSKRLRQDSDWLPVDAILEEQQKRAAELKLRTDRAQVMSERDVGLLRADIKVLLSPFFTFSFSSLVIDAKLVLFH